MRDAAAPLLLADERITFWMGEEEENDARARERFECAGFFLSFEGKRVSVGYGIELLMSMSLCACAKYFYNSVTGVCALEVFFCARSLLAFLLLLFLSRFDDAFKPCRRFRIDGFSFRSTLTRGEWKKKEEEEDARFSALLNLTPRATIERR